VPSRGQVLSGQVVVDGPGHLVVGHRGVGGHVRDQVREHQVRAALAVLAVMLVSVPALAGVPLGGLLCCGSLAAGAGRGIVAGLGDVQLVAQPELLALGAPPGVGVIR
jgi:hypothetical protein